MNKKELLGLKIREIRKKSNMTQEQFSEKIGIEPPSLSNIEKGKSYPSMQTVLNIIQEFNITPQEIFDNEYYEDESVLEQKVLDIFKNLTIDKKRIIFRLIQDFDI